MDVIERVDNFYGGFNKPLTFDKTPSEKGYAGSWEV